MTHFLKYLLLVIRKMAVLKLRTLMILIIGTVFGNNNKIFGKIRRHCIPRSYGMDSIVCVCNATYCDTIHQIKPLPSSDYAFYTSNQAGLRFQKTTQFFIANDTIDKNSMIIIHPNITYQTIIGWGGGFTDASGFNIHNLSDWTKENILRSYFSKQGIEYNLGRVPMGSSDFSTHPYSYDDGEEDEGLQNFKLAPEDYKYKIPLLQQATKLSNGTLWLLASAWTAPKWMKTNTIGFLRSPMYQAWANYFLKFLDLYWEQWIDFWGITTGNQASLRSASSVDDTGYMLPNQMRFWINNYLGPTLRKSDFKSIKLFVFDDEIRFLSTYIDKLFLSTTTRNYTDGIAIHSHPEKKRSFSNSLGLGLLYKNYPEKLILNTEASMANTTKISLGAWQNGEDCANDIIMNLNNWVMGWMESNLALDMAGGPSYARSSDSAIIVNPTADEFYKQPMFYAIGHFSKFIPRGSIRIDFSNHHSKLQMVAFKKPDDGIVIVVLNRKSSDIPIIIRDGRRGDMDLTMKAKSLTTILYW